MIIRSVAEQDKYARLSVRNNESEYGFLSFEIPISTGISPKVYIRKKCHRAICLTTPSWKSLVIN